MVTNIYIGYLVMLKAGCVIIITILFICIYIRAVRQANRPNWVPIPKNLMTDLLRRKFDPTSAAADSQCIICMVEYEADDEIIPLPCNENHYFHADCIENWLKQNNTCPLCKQEITQEAIKNQKKTRPSLRSNS